MVLIFFIYKKDQIIVDEFEGDRFENYDLILTKGQSFQSKLISLLNFSLEDYSHIGVISKENENIFILHSTPDGTENNSIRYDDLQSFFDLSDACDYKVLRYKNITPEVRQKLKNEFAKHKTTSVPFDYDFNNFDHKKIYCSELVLIIYNNSGLLKMIDSNYEKPIYPKDFLKMNDFILVK